MQMAQPVERSVLADFGIRLQEVGQNLENDTLHWKVLAAALPVISALPFVADRVPPHKNGGFQWYRREETLEQNRHRFDAFAAGRKGHILVPDNVLNRAVEGVSVDCPETLFQLSL